MLQNYLEQELTDLDVQSTNLPSGRHGVESRQDFQTRDNQWRIPGTTQARKYLELPGDSTLNLTQNAGSPTKCEYCENPSSYGLLAAKSITYTVPVAASKPSYFDEPAIFATERREEERTHLIHPAIHPVSCCHGVRCRLDPNYHLPFGGTKMPDSVAANPADANASMP